MRTGSPGWGEKRKGNEKGKRKEKGNGKGKREREGTPRKAGGVPAPGAVTLAERSAQDERRDARRAAGS